MAIEIRPARQDEIPQLGAMGAYVYGGAFGDGEDNVVSRSQRPEWTLCAFDGDTMATSFAAFPFTIRANGNAMAMAGITAVGTRPEYRRRGLLRQIMTQAFVQQRERGQSLAGLWASQAAIYQRYGFATLGAMRTYQIDTVDITFNAFETGETAVKRFAGSDALQDVKSVYRQFAEQRFGYLHRAQPMWMDTIYGYDATQGPLWTAVAYEGGQAVGYVIYTLRADKVAHAARGQEIVIRDLAWLNLPAYHSLWQYVAAHDLVGRVSWKNAPVDDPLTELLAEPRMCHCRDEEPSWLRIVDVEAALAQRGYSADGDIVLGVADDRLAPWNSGTWHLRVTGGVAEVAATSRPAEVTLSVKALTSAYSGTRRLSDLQRWGMVDAAEDLSRHDMLFSTHGAPHCPDHY